MQVHLEMREARTPAYWRKLEFVTIAYTIMIGISVATVGCFMIVSKSALFVGNEKLLNMALDSNDDSGPAYSRNMSAGNATAPPESKPTASFQSYMAFVSARIVMVALAATLCTYEPSIVGSGMPLVKSNLNGADVSACALPVVHRPLRLQRMCPVLYGFPSPPPFAPYSHPPLLTLCTTSFVRAQILTSLDSGRTLAAKVMATLLTVGSGLPTGQDGPLIHIGAMVSLLMKRIPIAIMGDQLPEFRTPSAQRTWVTIGASAGIIVAFQAPLSGILYTFEEVSTFWSSYVTQRCFLCAISTVISLMVLRLVVFCDETGPCTALDIHEFIVGTGSYNIDFFGFMMLVVVSVLGSLVGAGYNVIIEKLVHRRLHSRWLEEKPRQQVAEAGLVALFILTLYSVAPLGFDCLPCPPQSDCAKGADGSSSGSSSASGSGGGHHVLYQQFTCPEGEFNEMATLLHSEYFVVIQHLFGHNSQNGHDFSIGVLASSLALCEDQLRTCALCAVKISSCALWSTVTSDSCRP